MRAIARLFAVVFFLGFIAMAAALAYGAMAGQLWYDHPFLSALRYFGIGLMAAGMTLWIVERRAEAGREGLNPLLWLLIVGAVIALVIPLIFANALGTSADLIGVIGVAFAAAALVIGLIAQLLSPAYPKGLTTRWPEGGEAGSSVTSPGHAETHEPDRSAH